MEGKYKNLDKKLKEQNLGHRKEKPPGLIELIVEQDPCKIPGYVCIPEVEYRRENPNKENGETYELLPIDPRNGSKQGEYNLLPIVEPYDPNKNIVKGYIYIPGWESPIPINLPTIVPEKEIGKYIGIVPVEEPKSKCKPEGVYWLPVYEPDCSRPGEYVLVPGVGYVWTPSLKPKFDEIKP